MEIVRTDLEIFSQEDLILQGLAAERGTLLPGLTYEEGCQAMLEWLTGRIEEPPLGEGC